MKSVFVWEKAQANTSKRCMKEAPAAIPGRGIVLNKSFAVTADMWAVDGEACFLYSNTLSNSPGNISEITKACSAADRSGCRDHNSFFIGRGDDEARKDIPLLIHKIRELIANDWDRRPGNLERDIIKNCINITKDWLRTYCNTTSKVSNHQTEIKCLKVLERTEISMSDKKD